MVGRRARALKIGVGALCAALAASVVALASPASAESNGGVKVMPLGDSITDGVPGGGGYRVDLWQKFGAGGYKVDFVGSLFNGPASLGDHDHEGHSGWRIDQIDGSVTGWLRTYAPRTILLHIGTNDLIQGRASGAESRLGTLLDRITAAAPSTDVFVSTIIPLSGKDAAVRTFNAAVPGLVQTRAAAGKRVHLVDMYPALTTADLADGVHPTAAGYAKMATVWYNALRAVPGSLGNGTTTTTTPPPSSTSPRPSTTTPRPSTTTPPPAGRGCTATVVAAGSWGSGYQGEVTVRNTGSSALGSWSVGLTLPGGQTLATIWSGVATGTSGAITVRNASYNGSVAAGASTSFGFIASGGTGLPTGLTCTAG